MGFTFDDTDTSGTTNSIATMNDLIRKDPRNAERIFPFIGGEEVNDDPVHAHHRYIIDFFDRTLDASRSWPDLVSIVERKVKPIRDGQKRDANRLRWWQYAEKRPGLYAAVRGLTRVLVTAQTSKYRSFVFLPSGVVYDQKLIVFPLDTMSALAMLQSRTHLEWAAFFGLTLKEDPVYTPSDCLETFPFPHDWKTDQELERMGQSYFDCRADLMVRNNEGLTKVYNRFHDPDEHDPGIVKLRALHAVMDRAVLDAYGWNDIQPSCEFMLLHEDDEDDEAGKASKKKKPWRYRWPDEVRDEVLGRLLELNAQRAREEGEAATRSSSARTKGRRKVSPASMLPLLDDE